MNSGALGEGGALLPHGMRWAGPALAALYGIGVKIHRATSRARVAPIATICIGNIAVGGTGKTPAAIYFARELLRRGRRPAILMRGYKAQGGDEAEEVKAALNANRGADASNKSIAKLPVILGADRHAGALEALKLGCDVALLDDGFQHWRLQRDLDIVLVDATDPFAGGALLPHGKLREPLEGLARADAIVVTRSDVLNESDRVRLQAQILRVAGSKPILFSNHAAMALRRIGKPDDPWPLEKLRGLQLGAACGIGNPNAFERTLKSAGAELLAFKRFDDHHAFTQADIASLQLYALENWRHAALIVVTEKDAVKIEKLKLRDDVPILALRVEFQIAGAEPIWEKIDAALRSGDARRTRFNARDG